MIWRYKKKKLYFSLKVSEPVSINSPEILKWKKSISKLLKVAAADDDDDCLMSAWSHGFAA